MLEAAGADFANVVVFHSLSKRSNLPGLRVGFAAGDRRFIAPYLDCATSLRRRCRRRRRMLLSPPMATKRMWRKTAGSIRANSISPTRSSATATATRARPADFFSGSMCRSMAAAKTSTLKLWREAGVRVVPGRYLAHEQTDGTNPGADYIRVAMVQDQAITAEALHRLVAVLG